MRVRSTAAWTATTSKSGRPWVTTGEERDTPEELEPGEPSIYWSETGLRIAGGGQSTLFYFFVGHARGTYPVRLKLYDDYDQPRSLEVDGVFTIPPQPQRESRTQEEALTILEAKHNQAVASAYRDIVRHGHELRDELVAGFQQAEEASAHLRHLVRTWCNRCVLWGSDAPLTPEERAALRSPQLAEDDAVYLARVADNLDALQAVGQRLGL